MNEWKKYLGYQGVTTNIMYIGFEKISVLPIFISFSVSPFYFKFSTIFTVVYNDYNEFFYRYTLWLIENSQKLIKIPKTENSSLQNSHIHIITDNICYVDITIINQQIKIIVEYQAPRAHSHLYLNGVV